MWERRGVVPGICGGREAGREIDEEGTCGKDGGEYAEV